jgi:UDP-N-acetylglucosamine:LPS N-acetylglucosamine transferase
VAVVHLPRPGAITADERVLAISSGGGHWVQLLRLRPAFDGCQVVYASTRTSNRYDVPGQPYHSVPEASGSTRLRAMHCAVRVAALLVRVRPSVIVTTGALPGYLAVRLGRVFRIRAIWVDSIANADRLSKSGEHVAGHVDVWLTQWEHLASPGGPDYQGSVLG